MNFEKQQLLRDIFGEDAEEDLGTITASQKIFDSEHLELLNKQFEADVSEVVQQLKEDSDLSDVIDSENDSEYIKSNKRASRKKTKGKKIRKTDNKREGQDRNDAVGDSGHADVEEQEEEEDDDDDDGEKQEENTSILKTRRKKSDFPEFDALLEPMKLQRSAQRRRMRLAEEDDVEDLGDETDFDAKTSSLIDRMRDAAEQDIQVNRRKLPAINKIKMLSEVSEQLSRRDVHLHFLDNGILDAMRAWLEPLPDGSLPSFDVRRTMLQFLETLPIDRDHLKESGIGKVIMFLYKHAKETDDNRRLCETLINKWSRPIFGLRSSYSSGKSARQPLDDPEEREEKNAHSSPVVSPSVVASAERRRSSGISENQEIDLSISKRPGDTGFSWHAHIPKPATFDYVIKPKSAVTAHFQDRRFDRNNTTPDTFKKLSQKMKLKR